MNYFRLSISVFAFLLCSQCSSDKESSISASDAKILEAVHKAKKEMNMTDAEVEQSIETVVKVYHQINQAVDQELMSIEQMNNFPGQLKKITQLMNELEISHTQSYLKVLQQLEKNELDKSKKYLRFMIALNYKTYLKKKDKAYLKFANEVKQYAETDLELKKLLDK